MRDARRHDEKLPRLDPVRNAAHGQFRPAINDLHGGIVRRDEAAQDPRATVQGLIPDCDHILDGHRHSEKRALRVSGAGPPFFIGSV